MESTSVADTVKMMDIVYKGRIKPEDDMRVIRLDGDHSLKVPPNANYAAVQEIKTSRHHVVYVHYQKWLPGTNNAAWGLGGERLPFYLRENIIEELENLNDRG